MPWGRIHQVPSKDMLAFPVRWELVRLPASVLEPTWALGTRSFTVWKQNILQFPSYQIHFLPCLSRWLVPLNPESLWGFSRDWCTWDGVVPGKIELQGSKWSPNKNTLHLAPPLSLYPAFFLPFPETLGWVSLLLSMSPPWHLALTFLHSAKSYGVLPSTFIFVLCRFGFIKDGTCIYVS